MKKRILTVLLAVCLVFALGTVALAAETPVAQIGDKTYTDLGTAFSEAQEDDIIKLLSDITLTNPVEIRKNETDKISFTLNLNGQKISAPGTVLDIYNSDITIENGTIETTRSDGKSGSAIWVNQNVNLNIADNAVVNAAGTEGANFGVAVYYGCNNINVTINGELTGSNGLTINGQVTKENNVSVAINGKVDVTHTAVYLAGYGDTSVNSSAYIKGNTGIEIRAGELTVNGGTIAGGNSYSSAEDSNGPTVFGAGIAVSQHTTNQNIDVRINRGNISGAVALAQEALQSGNNADQVKIDVAGGSFKATAAQSEAIKATNVDTVTITGGKFQKSDGSVSDIDDYLAPGLDVDEDGDVVVGSDAVAQVGDTVYTNLQEAINAAITAKKPVEILKDFTITVPNGTAVKTGAVNINGNVTIDGNHKTITAGEGFIIKDGTGLYHVINIQGNATVTIKNLSINGANMARSGINVFGDATSAPVVTLTDVDVKNCTTYGVTNGSAKVTASDLTTNGNRWGGVNVDSKNADATFKMTSGTLADNYSVVVGESASNKSVVNLDGGTYNTVQVKVSNTDVNISRGTYGKIELTSGVNKGVVDVTGGTFKTSVSEYVVSSMPYEAKTSSGLYTYHRTPESAADAAGQGGYVNYILGGVTHDVTLYYDKYVQTEIEVPHNYDFELPGGKYDGKEIIGWTRGSVTYKDGDEVEIDRDMTFYVVLKDGEFDIVIDSKIEHGDISTNVNSADKGDTVYIYVDPDTGYVLDDIDVYYGLNYRYSVKVSYVRNNTYRFEMPNADVYITATFKANGMPFVDVHRTQWFYDSIYYVWSNDMMEGDSATTFNPDGTMTRAMFWAVLGRMDGQTITGTNWVEQARNWAMREGVSDGTNPNDYVTREQMVTMLWRYAGEKNGSANLNRYTDSGSVSGYAVEAMRWAIGTGVIQGVTSTTLAPKANATRAECATIFMRFDKM